MDGGMEGWVPRCMDQLVDRDISHGTCTPGCSTEGAPELLLGAEASICGARAPKRVAL